MKSFRDLKVWEKSHHLTLTIYRLTKSFPREELYGLSSQIRRSALSIPSNIAEGCGRGSNVDFARFLQIAMGSASELEYQLLLAYDLDYLTTNEFTAAASSTSEIKRMLSSLISKVYSDC